MLFNSYVFLFGFFPVALALFFVCGRRSQPLAIAWLILASLVFYAWWRPLNVLIIGPAILVNYGFARWLQRPASGEAAERRRLAVLSLGIVANVLFLGYFKYSNFFVGAVNDAAGTHFVFEQVILPLGISFITFQKIAFLIDVWSRRVTEFTLREYALFVLFFPQLIAGPIVHYREMMPQFRVATCRPDRTHLAVGLTLLAFGLFKKVVLADGIAMHVTPIYGAAAAGQAVSLVPAWIAAVGFTLQIYFDFSGYSDMAIGIARCFGVRLPANFDSPLKATSIVDFWLRWHMTLTRFLTSYLYNPVVLRLTRRRQARGLPPFGGRNVGFGAFLQMLAWPTVLTMFVSGFWHGAGYTFIVWGLLHGAYLVVNHAWRIYVARRLGPPAVYARRMRPFGAVLTFLCVIVAMVIFRAPTLDGARIVLEGLVGGGGLELPRSILARLPWKSGSIVGLDTLALDWVTPLAWIAAGLAVAWLLPNTGQLLSPYEPALGLRADAGQGQRWSRRFAWQPAWPWALAVAALVVAAVFAMGGKSEFLYWQF